MPGKHQAVTECASSTPMKYLPPIFSAWAQTITQGCSRFWNLTALNQATKNICLVLQVALSMTVAQEGTTTCFWIWYPELSVITSGTKASFARKVALKFSQLRMVGSGRSSPKAPKAFCKVVRAEINSAEMVPRRIW